MTAAESRILAMFCRYQVRPAEMLFVNPRECQITTRGFASAMGRLIEKGLVIKERPHHAYSLTRAGYAISRSRQSQALAASACPSAGRGPSRPAGCSARMVRQP